MYQNNPIQQSELSGERKKGRKRNATLADELSRAIQQRDHAAQSLRRVEDLISKEKVSAELRAAVEVDGLLFTILKCYDSVRLYMEI